MMVVPMIAQDIFVSDRLTKKWETAAGLKVPESVFFDETRNMIIVSNVTGSPTDKDGTGFLSLLSPDGKIINLKWITGLNAPKGIGIAGDFLYVSDISKVVKVDIADGKIVETVDIPDATFLNDITTDSQGNVYISDSQGNSVYVLNRGKYELLVKSEKLKGINGLYFIDGSLLAGLQNGIVNINPKTKEIKDYIMNTGGVDGLVPDGKGNYLISDWLGHVHLTNPGKDKIKLLDTTPGKINAADIEYVKSKKLLLVPTFNDNKVVAYEVN
jgi:outer membrane protein assembly factor BamB